MKTGISATEAGRHSVHSWHDIITFDGLDDARAQRAVLECEGFAVRLRDERRLQRFWFWTPPQAGIHVQIAAESLATLKQRLGANPALILPAVAPAPGSRWDDGRIIQFITKGSDL